MRMILILWVTSAVLLTGCGGSNNKIELASATGIGTASEAAPEAVPTQSKLEESESMNGNAEQIGQALKNRAYDDIYNQTSDIFRKEISLAQFREGILGYSEGVTAWKSHSQIKINDGQYNTWTDQESKKGIIAIIDTEGVITGLQLMPLESFPQTDQVQTKLAYGIPFKGEWFVFWGGQDVLSNYHYEVPSQRYAYDVFQVKAGFTYDGDATKNESYYAFGQEIVAPQSGTVVQAINDIKDNEPVGVMNEDHPAGNVVVIDHGNGEYSFLAHLQMGSVKVKVGDQVSKGDSIGLCGNSGNSSEAHLHYQVSDNKDLFEGESIRVQWEGGLNPRQGEVIAAD
ncbi:M23 family metallopeptidase [Cohnella sp. WQ 127256]|uniref:M23 family metallopeptidase n=1 Tax=Cohnella sp. WQ 127256 TaxID=2938790 RepID=UPI002117DA6B|nr:M23 family metallopeptidase [Cohnella sp. WQ 127256]